MAKLRSRSQTLGTPATTRTDGISRARTALVIGLVVLGLVWIVVYVNVAMDAANFIPGIGLKKPSDPLPWMSDLKKWNLLIGFALIIVGLVLGADQRTPLGRGRGVVVGMLACFLIGLLWVVLYYFTAGSNGIPVMRQLGQLNLGVGIAFMAAGFAYATRWE